MPEADLDNTNKVLTVLEAYEQALKSYQSALQVYQEIGDRLGEATLQNRVGSVLRRKGDDTMDGRHDLPVLPPANPPDPPDPRRRSFQDFNEALAAHQKALEIYQQENKLLNKATTLMAIGDTYFSIGKSASRISFR
jgi:tetratricopeptide (TPR) repeat protein